MRVAIWSAVSSKKQAAEEKTSLKDQVQIGLDLIASKGWRHAGTYIVPGESRSAHISLVHAEEAIPQLHNLLEDASKHKFDLLFVYDLNRFRNLMLQVFETLCGYNIQIYNHDDPLTPVPPSQYTHERQNAVRLNIKLHDIISGQETNTLAKHYREKMPKRITEKKLHPGLGLSPYGYRKPASLAADRNAVLQQNPAQVRILHQIRDWFLEEGLSLTEIASRLNQQNIPSPRGKRWWYSIVRYVLANPYYAGVVRFGVSQRRHDKRNRLITRAKGQNPVSAEGIHKPVWSIETHRRILHELERRSKAQPGIAARPLSRLLRCQCGATLWAQVTPAGQYWRCSTGETRHTYINDKNAVQLFLEELEKALKNLDDIPLPQPEDKTAALQAEIRDLKAKQTRWMDAYEDESIDRPELNARLSRIQTRLTQAQNRLQQLQQDRTRSLAARQNLSALASTVKNLPRWFHNEDPRRINALLHTVIETAVITRRPHRLTLTFR